mgnify:CR=1 FL=1
MTKIIAFKGRDLVKLPQKRMVKLPQKRMVRSNADNGFRRE